MEVCIVGFFDLLRDGFAEPGTTALLNGELGAKTPWYRVRLDRGLGTSAANRARKDISILSDEFLAEIQGMEKKNLALEALKKLINGEIKSKLSSRVVKTKVFSDRLAEAINRYHTNALTTAQVLAG